MKKFFSFCLMLISLSAQAGTQEGQITSILNRASDGLHYFRMSGTAVDKPDCASGSYWMIKDENSTAGKSQFSMVLTAYASGKMVQVIGSGKCDRWHDGEDVNSIILK
ncbi:hypothetical protein ACJJIG_17890 [Microbulbifer sp. SSSA007]|uniref:hypothetical protein n=1 Tax=Microbulbifer sp. SSSA007 TaxID=3243379 RepID=UPI0040395E94